MLSIIKALPETPDCVIIAVPREAVEPIVVECAERRVGGIIIYSSGYSETGKSDREKQQARLVQISRESGVRILGPNCIGALNYKNGFHATFAAVPDASLPTLRPDAIGLVSQSGALGFALSQAIEHGISFSHVLTCGNACDVDVADEISYLADDPNCKVIACVFEGMSNPSRIIEAAEIAHVANKPVIIYKMVTGEQGAAAAMSHTGSLAGSNAAYRAAFKRVGIVVVDNFEALIETAAFFGKASRPKAPGVAVVATSGGACIMVADKAELYNVQLPQPVSKTREVLERVVPEFGSPKNPCDVTAQVLGSPESLHACVDALMSDDTFGALVVPQPLGAKSFDSLEVVLAQGQQAQVALEDVAVGDAASHRVLRVDQGRQIDALEQAPDQDQTGVAAQIVGQLLGNKFDRIRHLIFLHLQGEPKMAAKCLISIGIYPKIGREVTDLGGLPARHPPQSAPLNRVFFTGNSLMGRLVNHGHLERRFGMSGDGI